MAQRMLVDRMVLSPGVGCGLQLTAITNGDQKGIRISPGLAIDGWGRLVVVPQAHDLIPLSITDECGQPATSGEIQYPVRICICYYECLTDFAPSLVTDPVCDGKQACEAGTWLESYCVRVLEGAAAPVQPYKCSADVMSALKAGNVH